MSKRGNEKHKVKTSLTHKKVVCVWIRPANTEKLHEIVKLAMDVAAYLNNSPSAESVES